MKVDVDVDWPGVRTKHGPPLWTRSMDHFHGPGPWTPCHGPGPLTLFILIERTFFYKIMRNELKQK